jgi:hypothetical protein
VTAVPPARKNSRQPARRAGDPTSIDLLLRFERAVLRCAALDRVLNAAPQMSPEREALRTPLAEANNARNVLLQSLLVTDVTAA